MLVFLAACEKEQPMSTTAAEASTLEFREEKVTICHVKGNGDRIVLNVSASSVEAHLAHGDELGDCSIRPDICEEYAGGIVFYVVPEGEEMDLDGDGSPDQGLVAAPVNTEVVGLTLVEIDPDRDDVFSYCERLDVGGYDDWFLPSIDQLGLMWVNLADINGDDANSGPEDPYNCGGFYSEDYVSSTLDARIPIGVQTLDFSNGTTGNGSNSDYRLRAVRAF